MAGMMGMECPQISLWASWLCCPELLCVLFLFNVMTIVDFWNQCFSMWTSNLASYSLFSTPYPIKKRTSVCKAVGTIREASWNGCWRPVTIVVGVFYTARYHESVNTVMSNLFITTDYWTRTQKHGSSYMWICLVKKGTWDSNTASPYGMCHFLLLQVIAGKFDLIRLCVCCQVTGPLDLDPCRGGFDPLAKCQCNLLQKTVRKTATRCHLWSVLT